MRRWFVATSVAALVSSAVPAFSQQPPPPPPADTTKRDTTKKDEGLPLGMTRSVDFETTEGTWMSLDVSPDGKTIVFELLGDLYTLPLAGGSATRITTGPAFDSQPRWSPDGKRIVFLSDRSGAENIWLCDAAGANRRGCFQVGRGCVGLAFPRRHLHELRLVAAVRAQEGECLHRVLGRIEVRDAA